MKIQSGKSYLDRCAKAGRVGPLETKLDKHTAMGQYILRSISTSDSEIESERFMLDIEAKSSFFSIRADTAVFKEIFYYEVTLKGDGKAQIGWS